MSVTITPNTGNVEVQGSTPILTIGTPGPLTLSPGSGNVEIQGSTPGLSIGIPIQPLTPDLLPPLPPSSVPPQIIPLQPIPSQTVTVTLADQPCRINVRQTSTGVYLDLYVNDALIIGGVICQNLNPIVRNVYLGFHGDLAFYDTQPSTVAGPSDPVYTGLGSRFVLEYFQGAP